MSRGTKHEKQRSSSAAKERLRPVPGWALLLGVLLAVPTHLLAWSWFLESGPDLIRAAALGLAPSRSWLTSTFYFPLTLVALAVTEFAAILPLNVIAVIFGLRRYSSVRDTKHVVS